MGMYFRFQVTLVQRSRGDSAVARAAYQACRRMTGPYGKVFDYSKHGIEHGHVVTLIAAPPFSPEWVFDPQFLWSAAVRAERRQDAQEARRLEISIPRDLPRKFWPELARALVTQYVKRGMVAQVDIHVTTASDGGINPHIHVILTMRRIVNGAFEKKKARDWNKYFHGNAKALREDAARIQNEFCKRVGVPFRADAASNTSRGLPASEIVIPRWNFVACRRTGKKTAWMEQHEAERAARRRIRDLENSLRAVVAEIDTLTLAEKTDRPIKREATAFPAKYETDSNIARQLQIQSYPSDRAKKIPPRRILQQPAISNLPDEIPHDVRRRETWQPDVQDAHKTSFLQPASRRPAGQSAQHDDDKPKPERSRRKMSQVRESPMPCERHNTILPDMHSLKAPHQEGHPNPYDLSTASSQLVNQVPHSDDYDSDAEQNLDSCPRYGP